MYKNLLSIKSLTPIAMSARYIFVDIAWTALVFSCFGAALMNPSFRNRSELAGHRSANDRSCQKEGYDDHRHSEMV